MADTVAGTSFGKDFWSMNRKKLVIMLAIFLPLVVTSSYTYFTTPDVPTEAVRFFKGRPFASFVPLVGSKNTSLSGSTHTSIFNSNATRNGTEVQLNFGDAGNTTSSFSTEPKGESIEPGAVAEDEEEAKLLDPISETKETSSTLGLLNQEPVNTTNSNMQKNFTLPNVTTSNISNDISSSHQQTEQSTIAMEGQGLSNVTSKGVCDFLKGSWVPESRQPAYTNATCNLILGAQNCMKNGRPDTGYLHWKWQPELCDLPSIDHRAFLSSMRDRRMIFVGDSIARNQFQSLLCLLSQGEVPENTYKGPDDRDNVFVFHSYNFTMAVYWSSYLVHVEQTQITLPNNVTDSAPVVHLDRLDPALVERLPGVDVLQISTGQWWFKFAYYVQKGQTIGCHTYPGMPECEDIGFIDPYRLALHNILGTVNSTPGFSGTTVFRSFSPDHFEEGSWSRNGHCVRTQPGGVPISAMSRTVYDAQMQVFHNVTGGLSAIDNRRLRLLDITSISQERPDGHPDVYKTEHPSMDNSTQGQHIQKDCLHWCLPGPIDTWNALFVQTLQGAALYP